MADIKEVKKALKSIREVVSHELDVLIEMDPDLQGDPKQQEREKQELLSIVNNGLKSVIRKIAVNRKASWNRVVNAFPERFSDSVKAHAAKVAVAGAGSTGGPGAALMDEQIEHFSVCPPGFEEQNGVCVRIG